MDPKLSAHFTQQSHQHPHLDLQGAFDPTTEEGIVKGLSDLILWVPLSHVGYSVVTQAVVLINHLKDRNEKIGEDPYLKLRKFAEKTLELVMVPENITQGRQKAIFFYDYPKNEVYFGYGARLESELPPIVMKATLGVCAVEQVQLDEAIKVTQDVCDVIQKRVFGAPLQPAPVPNPEVDWEFIMRIDHVPFESAFKVQFIYHLKPMNFTDPELVWEAFKDKYNLSRILNGGQRTQMDLRVFCVRAEVHWEWVKSE